MILFLIINGKPSAIEWNKNQIIFHKKIRVFLINQNKTSNWENPLFKKTFTPFYHSICDFSKINLTQKISKI